MTVRWIAVKKSLLLISALTSALGHAQGGDGESNIACALTIRIPNYPSIARAARIVGTATVSILLGNNGKPKEITVTGVKPILRKTVEEELSLSEYSPSCTGRRIRLIFD